MKASIILRKGIICAKEPCISTKEDHISATALYIPEQEPWVAAKEPCISRVEQNSPISRVIESRDIALVLYLKIVLYLEIYCISR